MKGDIAEQAVVLFALKANWNVLHPVGDRLPYDLVLDVDGVLIKVQVKSAWFDSKKENYVVDNRRTKTNRKKMVRSTYQETDFAIIYIQDLDIFYIMPSSTFINYGSEIHLVETSKRQRKPKSFEFRNAWNLIQQWAVSVEMPE
ncbi:MAG: hypothetical protein KDC34_08305 [Saprospiraceae bacterium]|nr:hypothetical protein [Saprospiraceae bacterium]